MDPLEDKVLKWVHENLEIDLKKERYKRMSTFSKQDWADELKNRELFYPEVGTYWRIQEGSKNYVKILEVKKKTKEFYITQFCGGESDGFEYAYWANGAFCGEEGYSTDSNHFEYPYVQVDSKGKKLTKGKKSNKVIKETKKLNDIWTL